jgi:hypothetical protein
MDVHPGDEQTSTEASGCIGDDRLLEEDGIAPVAQSQA